jgi:hypothetical protein
MEKTRAGMVPALTRNASQRNDVLRSDRPPARRGLRQAHSESSENWTEAQKRYRLCW